MPACHSPNSLCQPATARLPGAPSLLQTRSGAASMGRPRWHSLAWAPPCWHSLARALPCWHRLPMRRVVSTSHLSRLALLPPLQQPPWGQQQGILTPGMPGAHQGSPPPSSSWPLLESRRARQAWRAQQYNAYGPQRTSSYNDSGRLYSDATGEVPGSPQPMDSWPGPEGGGRGEL